MKEQSDRAKEQCLRLAAQWMADFSNSLERKEYARAAELIHPDGYWRDLLAFGWDFKVLHGFTEVGTWLAETFFD